MRRLFTILSAVSLLLCVATCGMWVRSYQVADLLRYNNPLWVYLASSSRGEVVLERFAQSNVPNSRIIAERPGPYEFELRSFPPEATGDHLGYGPYERGADFGYANGWDTPMSLLQGVVFPWSVPSAALAVLPLLRVLAFDRKRKRRRRARAGRCPACGYDLRATPGRCPECGARSEQTGAT